MAGLADRRSEKKLTDAARYWARGSETYELAIEDLKKFNAPEEVISELAEMQANEDFEVWEENWPAVSVFLKVQTQWRATYGTYYGLDYSVVLQIINMYHPDKDRDILEQVQVIEYAALSAMNEARDNG